MARSVAAGVLLGISTATQIVLNPRLGSSVGLLWFYESGRTVGAGYPWSHVDLEALRARAVEQGYGWSVPPGGRVQW